MGLVRTALWWVGVSTPFVLWLSGYATAGMIPAETRPIIGVYALPATDRFLVGGLPHRWFHSFAIFDLCAAGPYMAHIAVPIVFLLWMICQNTQRERIARFVWAFGWMNVMALATQLALPTAPPWFYDTYTNDLHPQMPSYSQKGFPAGLLRVDELLGTSIFRVGYSQSPVVYGAFPSMHCGWPFIVALHYTDHPQGTRYLLVHGYSMLLAWAAMYLRHHYLTDVLGGFAYAYVFTKLAEWTFTGGVGGEKYKKTPQLNPSPQNGPTRTPGHRRPHSADFGTMPGFAGSSLVSALTLPSPSNKDYMNQSKTRTSLCVDESSPHESENLV